MDATFEKALASEGQPYLEAENQLRSGGEPALATLKGRVQDPDPFTRFVAQTLLDWMEGRAPDNQKALDYLDTLPAKLRRTPITGPSPLGVASYLATHFEARVGNVLVLRLVKALDWPRWRILGVLFYLKDQKAPGATAGLIRFAAETKNDEYRAAAVDAIKAAGDPDVGAKILAEKNRLEKLNRQLHGSILSIESPG